MIPDWMHDLATLWALDECGPVDRRGGDRPFRGRGVRGL